MPTNRNLIKAQVATYAEVLLEAARNEGRVFEINAQLEEALHTIRGSMELRDALRDSTIPAEARTKIVKGVFKDFDPALVNTLAVIVERDFVDNLSQVCEAYTLRAEEASGAVVVDVSTAVELTDELRETLKKKLSANFDGKDIVLQEHVDKSILGGIILSAHGKRIDASVTSQLERARLVLSTEPAGGER
ncbi:MAG: ATP synthase F1 subunit delta [Coriobacteriales bacterium]